MENHLVHWECKKFDEISTAELYQILQLRTEVFVCEQDCVYQDMDGQDQKSMHLFATKNKEIIAYARLLPYVDKYQCSAIGRVVVKDAERKNNYGRILMILAIEVIHNTFKHPSIRISAQTYLTHFYQSLGFLIEGEEYLEDNLPHIQMYLSDGK
ncbi:MAG: GNAT family N-acetyltransferase [Flavobacteriales bacterium]|jgi:ElaA protein|nr:GNAT family N-acetyltransferase [Flavobacteriales bacterium]